MFSSPGASKNTSVGGVDGGEDIGAGGGGSGETERPGCASGGGAAVRGACEVDEVCVESVTVPFATIQRWISQFVASPNLFLLPLHPLAAARSLAPRSAEWGMERKQMISISAALLAQGAKALR